MINNALIVKRTLKKYGILAPLDEISTFFYLYPDSGSIKSVEQALRNFGVNCSIVKGNTDALMQIGEMNIAFIAHFKKDKSFILVEKISPEKVLYFDPNKNSVNSISVEEFKTKTSGYFVIPNDSPRKASITQKIISLNNSSIKILAILIFAFNLLQLHVLKGSYSLDMLLFIDYLGIALCYFLMRADDDDVKLSIEQVCSSIGSKCTDLINKKNEKIFNVFSLPELGLIYFMFGLLCVNFGAKESVPILTIFNIPTLIFGIYSVYYQAFRSKSFCLFCSVVVILFYCQFFIINYFFYTINDISLIYSLVLTGLAGFASLGIVLLARTLIDYKFNLINKQLNLAKFKYAEKILDQQARKTTSLPEASKVFIFGEGQHRSKHELNVVINPFCPPCKTAFESLRKLMIQSRHDELSVSIVLSVNLEHEYNTPKHKISRRIISEHLKGSPNADYMIKLLNDWFSSEDKEKWPAENDPSFELDQLDNILKEHKSWIINNEITYTPALVLDNKLLPKGYTADEIKYLL